MIPWLSEQIVFPDVRCALKEPEGPNGLLAAGGDLSPQRLLAAYGQGIFPWYSPGEPILWWSPDPRMVLPPAELKISRSLAKVLRNGTHEVRLDTAFMEVMKACAAPRATQHGTWISAEMQAAYLQLHQLGYAHSVEVWMADELVGGLYGVALGRIYFGESMFSRRSNASKIALTHLCHHLQYEGFQLIDCQMHTPHLASLGARLIPRAEFIDALASGTQAGPRDARPGPWPAHATRNAFRSTPSSGLLDGAHA